jgi:hypothetical protein
MSSAGFDVHQEDDVLPSRRLARIGLTGIAVGAAGVLAATLLMVATVGPVALNRSRTGPPPPGPRRISGIEQTPIGPSRDGEDLRDSQRRDLESLGWIDRDAGIAHIPIERAMDLVRAEPR